MVIQIALTTSQRDDKKLGPLLEAAEEREDWKSAVHAVLVHSVHNGQIRRLLIDAFRLIPEAPKTLYDVLKSRAEQLARELHAETNLVAEVTAILEQSLDQEASGGSLRLEDIIAVNEKLYALEDVELSYENVDPVAETNLNWGTLSDLIEVAAERLWRDHFIQYRTEKEAKRDWKSRKPTAKEQGRRFHLTLLTRQSHALMLLWLECSLYRLRAVSNSEAREGVPTDRPKTRSDVQVEVKSYLRTLDNWDNELHTITGNWYFRKQFGDGQRLRVLSSEFGPSKVDASEKGWAPVAPDAHDALRYAYFEVLRKESVRARKPLAALGYYTLWITAGYGTQPLRFAGTALTTIGLTAMLFFLNDFFNPGITNTSAHFCREANVQVTSWSGILPTLIHYLYMAITNLSSLGSNSQLARYCGGAGTQVILTFSAIAGYFLLAILASLFFQLLTEKD